MNVTMTMLDTCIQYGVLGILGFVAIKTFITQSRISNKMTKELVDYITSEKSARDDVIIDSLCNIMKVITKDHESLIKYKYEIMTELQKINSLLKTFESDEEQANKIYFKVQEIENSIIKIIKFEDRNIIEE